MSACSVCAVSAVDSFSSVTRQRLRWALHAFRCLVATHYLAELYSKTVHPGFAYWSGVIRDADMPAPEAELTLVIVLLIIGCGLLLSGRYMPIAAACLTLFQVPTTALFETNPYEQLKSVSLIAAILHVALTEHLLNAGLPVDKALMSGHSTHAGENTVGSSQSAMEPLLAAS